MSFIEIRGSNQSNIDLTEQLRILGYPNVVSLEGFRESNFELVSDLLFWLVKWFVYSNSVGILKQKYKRKQEQKSKESNSLRQ